MEKNQNQVLTARLNIKTLAELADIIEYRASDILYIATHANKYYSSFPRGGPVRPFAKKINPKKVRWIDSPIGPLKEMQKRINENILVQVDLPDYICGGVKGKSTVKNALMHKRSGALVKIDIKNYFPSISRERVYQIWCDIVGCPPEVADILTKLTTYRGYLPQGAHTSTSLANIFISTIDEPIRTKCTRLDVSYSIWVDDMVFSGKEARRIIPVAVRTIKSAGLVLSRRKLKVMGAGDYKIITGVGLGPEPSVPSYYRNRVRSAIHKLRNGEVSRDQLMDYLEQLEGSIAYIKNINQDQGEKLKRDFEIAKTSLPAR